MARINIFRNMPDARTFIEGQVIFRQGEAGDTLCGVVEGEVEIVLDEVVVSVVKPGGFFGELSLLDKEPRAASAIARSDCQVVFIDEARFYALVQRQPQFGLHILRVLSTRLRRRERELLDQIAQLQSRSCQP